MAQTGPVNPLAAILRDAAAILNRTRHGGWALVGGLAVGVRSEPRFTRDVDLAAAVQNDREAESLTRSFIAEGYAVSAALENEETGRLATVRLFAPGYKKEGPIFDLLFASSGIESEVVSGAEEEEVFSGLLVPVANRGHLLALKVLSRSDSRPQDAIDIHALLREADESDLDRAREAVSLIVRRGYARGKDLATALEGFIEKK